MLKHHYKGKILVASKAEGVAMVSEFIGNHQETGLKPIPKNKYESLDELYADLSLLIIDEIRKSQEEIMHEIKMARLEADFIGHSMS